jgi:hypothetical protein
MSLGDEAVQTLMKFCALNAGRLSPFADLLPVRASASGHAVARRRSLAAVDQQRSPDVTVIGWPSRTQPPDQGA